MQAALSRQARVNTSMATNPNYTMSELGASFSYGETAAYIIVLGDKENGLVNRSRVEYLFGRFSSVGVEVVVCCAD